jgi:hypothetical protein
MIAEIVKINPSFPVSMLQKKNMKKSVVEEVYKHVLDGGTGWISIINNSTKNQKKRIGGSLGSSKDEQAPRPPVEKKKVQIIDFTDSEGSDTEIDEDQLPTEVPVLRRQDAIMSPKYIEEVKPKYNKTKVKSELRKMMGSFAEDIKKLLNDFKNNRDKDFLADNYNIILSDQEEIFIDFLEDVEADDDLFNYATSLLEPHSRRINRMVN